MNTAEETLDYDGITSITPIPKQMNKGIPLSKVLDLKERGLSHTEIAKVLGCDRSNVSNRLKAYGATFERIEGHKKHRADILTHIQSKLLDGITPDKIKESSATQLITGMAILYDKERLERGKSSTNLSVAGLVEAHNTNLEALTADIAKLSQDLDTE
jgi:predicted transcriptional regulator